jgi:predicted transcriptional regulator
MYGDHTAGLSVESATALARAEGKRFARGWQRMDPQILIDAIVRQTMVLIARLSTVDGVRSPLSHIANEVFVGLVRELENQGVGKKVIADMFGLALRSYRQKVQRLSESVTTRGVTLWSAVHMFLAERESATRAELLAHFKHDEESSVRSILNDLVESGLVLRSGRGRETRYRVATEEELEELGASASANSQETNHALVWVHVYRESPLRKDRLAQLVPLPTVELDQAIHALVADGQIRVEHRDDGTYFATEHCLIPVGQAAGWEAAIVDHHRAVLNALAAKVTSGRHVSAANDEVGGTTVTYDLWPGHPQEEEVRRLLATTRDRVIPLWHDNTAYNRERQQEVSYKVTFYCGQYLVEEEDGA